MKLKYLRIVKFKNLSDISIDFGLDSGLTMIAGDNGTGKSNLLEALSAIFANAYLEKVAYKFDYLLVYEINGKKVDIQQNNGICKYKLDGKDISIRELKKQDSDGYLPKNVIALYSGEDKRLWHSYYEPFYKKFIKDVKKSVNTSSQKMYYINKYYWDIALLSLIYGGADNKFLHDDIGINVVNDILLFYSNLKSSNYLNGGLKKFLDKINQLSIPPDAKDEVADSPFFLMMDFNFIKNEYGVEISDEYVVDKKLKLFKYINPNFLKDKFDERPNDFIYDKKDFFDYFVQLFMPKDKKIINNIEIIINDKYSTKNLSEGEKQIILMRAVLSLVADEKSLVLLDEPDANLNEERKALLYKMFDDFKDNGRRQVVLTTHSPTLLNLAKDNEYIFLKSENKKVTVLKQEELNVLKVVFGNIYDVFRKSMELSSNESSLVIFEGETDVKYVRRAMELFKVDPKYAKIDVDFLSAGGAGNAPCNLDTFKTAFPHKKIIFFFDRDDAGKKAAAELAKCSKDDEKIVHYKDTYIDNVTVSFIPYKDGITQGDFLIEDYFDWDLTIKKMVDDKIQNKHFPFKELPNLSKYIKDELSNSYNGLSKEEFKGFRALLDKIYDLTVVQNSTVSEES